MILTVTDPETLAASYCDTLGMHRLDANGTVAVGYGGAGARLVLVPATTVLPYTHDTKARYWKIAITVPDLDYAVRALRRQGVAVTDPRQFREIAYLCHLTDREGHVIELLQHTFAQTPRTGGIDESHPLGGGAQIGLVTLRTSDLATDRGRCEALGMAYLSRQRVSDLGFDLYFFGCTDEAPPAPDVDAVENREWLWRRPYTVLEFQHRLDGEVHAPVDPGVGGAACVGIDTPDGRRVVVR